MPVCTYKITAISFKAGMIFWSEIIRDSANAINISILTDLRNKSGVTIGVHQSGM